MLITCVRREAKNRWERRAPLTPEAVRRLVRKGLEVWVETCVNRIFPDQAYEDAGAKLVADGSKADLILGIKEPEIEHIRENQVHVAFSHTIKGQSYNMGLLQTFLDQQGTLIDYETMRDENGERIIAFGRYAGIAGAVDTLHLLGRKWAQAGTFSGLSKLTMTHAYGTVDALKSALGACQPLEGEPLQVLIVGTGKVGKGCVEVCQWLGLPEISVDQVRKGAVPQGHWYAVAKTEDVFAHREGKPYDKAEFRELGAERYVSVFDQYLGHFNVLLQTNYWENHYPRQLPKSMLLEHRKALPPVIGDISCDIEGSLELTLEATQIDHPGKTYLPLEHRLIDEVSDAGPTIMSIDHLPCELSLDATNDFSKILEVLIPVIAGMDRSKPLATSGMTPLLQDATIVYKGELAPNFETLQVFLDSHQAG